MFLICGGKCHREGIGSGIVCGIGIVCWIGISNGSGSGIGSSNGIGSGIECHLGTPAGESAQGSYWGAVGELLGSRLRGAVGELFQRDRHTVAHIQCPCCSVSAESEIGSGIGISNGIASDDSTTFHNLAFSI